MTYTIEYRTHFQTAQRMGKSSHIQTSILTVGLKKGAKISHKCID